RHAEGVTCAVFAPDGKTVITASHDSTLRAWDTATGKELRRFVGHRGPVRQIALSPNGALLASWGEIAEEQDHIRIWDVAKSKELLQLDLPQRWVDSLAWASDSKTLAIGGDEGNVQIWDAVSGKELRSFVGHKGSVGSVAFSPDGKMLAWAGRKDGSVRLVD